MTAAADSPSENELEFWTNQKLYCATLMDGQAALASLLEFTQSKAANDPM